VSYALNPQVIRAAAPGAANDNTQGFVVGSIWVDSTPAIDQAYICTSAATGAATWIAAGGVTAHSALTPLSLGWAASAHTGTTNSVACFNGAGAALNVQATAEGSVLTFTGGVLTFAVFSATVSYVSDRAFDIAYNDTLNAAADAFVLAGSML
jgi:hypothetical protein